MEPSSSGPSVAIHVAHRGARESAAQRPLSSRATALQSTCGSRHHTWHSQSGCPVANLGHGAGAMQLWPL